MIKLKTSFVGIFAVVILFGGIGVSALAGYWNVSSTKQPALIKTGDFEGLPNPSDIRGSYTWADVSTAFGIPVASLLEAFGAVDPAAKVNSLETLYAGKVPEGFEIGTDSVRLFVSLLTAIPHTIEEGTILPASAIPVLSREAKADTALVEAAVKRSVTVLSGEVPAGTSVSAPAAAAEPAKTTASEPAKTATSEPAKPVSATAVSITGKTTFQNLKDAGYDMKKVEAITGTVENLGETIKAFSESKGIEFSELKTKLGEL